MDLNLPAYDHKVKRVDGKLLIYDVIRKKYVALTPEEWVRQHFVHYLITSKNYPAALIAVEKEIDLYGTRRRFDIVCYDRNAAPCLIVECKAPSVPLSQNVFDQVFGYNLTVCASNVAITNGITHFCGHIESGKGYSMLPEIPAFPTSED